MTLAIQWTDLHVVHAGLGRYQHAMTSIMTTQENSPYRNIAIGTLAPTYIAGSSLRSGTPSPSLRILGSDTNNKRAVKRRHHQQPYNDSQEGQARFSEIETINHGIYKRYGFEERVIYA
jgi:hypothetical protein